MDERKKIIPLPIEILFAAYIDALKSIEIPYDYFLAEDGNYYAFTDFLMPMHADAPTPELCRDDLVEALRITAESFYGETAFLSSSQKLCMMKIIFSSDEELKQCLRGKLTEDI